jgi:aldehyde:ferredoxin oxidoreductase
MLEARTENPTQVTDFTFTRGLFDVSTGRMVELGARPVEDHMDFLGGIGRSFKIMSEYDVTDPFAPASPLAINIGCLTGTAYMTGLRTFFTAFSPLKRTLRDMPMPAWSAMSGSFGRKLRSTGLDDLILVGRADTPQILVIRQNPNGPRVELETAPREIVGARTPEKIAYLNRRFNDREKRRFPAHFAVIGPAGENWEKVWYACIVGTTQEQVMSGEDKFRFAGRLGMGSVLGSKNILGVVAYAEKDHYLRGDEKLKAINREIGRGEQGKNYRHPENYDGGGGTGRLEKVLDSFGVLPHKNFEPRGENLSVSTHIETVRESPRHIVIDKNCFGCQIACHMDVYAAPEGGKDPDLRKARRDHGPFLGRFEYEPMELTGPNLGIDDPDDNLKLARLTDDLGLDAISSGVVCAFLMDYNTRHEGEIAGGIRFGDAAGAARVMEELAYGREPLFGKGVKKISEEIGGRAYAMHSKGVEHSAYLGQTNPGYPFATAGGHVSMRTYLAYMIDPNCKPESADYWVDQITNEGWKIINVNLHGGCLFALAPAQQTVEAVTSLYPVQMGEEDLIEATHRTHILGFALELKQGATIEDYDLAEEIFVGNRKGDLPGAHFLTRELFEEIRSRVLDRFKKDATRFGYLQT